MKTLFGFIVTRAKHGACKNPIWAGYTEKCRESHKKWILDNVSNFEFDGETAFQDVESMVTIFHIGQVVTLKSGRFWHIESIEPSGRCYGRIYKNKILPKIIPEGLPIKHGHVNYKTA